MREKAGVSDVSLMERDNDLVRQHGKGKEGIGRLSNCGEARSLNRITGDE